MDKAFYAGRRGSADEADRACPMSPGHGPDTILACNARAIDDDFMSEERLPHAYFIIAPEIERLARRDRDFMALGTKATRDMLPSESRRMAPQLAGVP